MNNNSPVLLIEDDKVDQKTMVRAFKELEVPNPLRIVENGIEGLNYLNNPRNKKPCLILLDLNMPKMSGIEFLDNIKADSALKQIPIVVLTTSDDDKDVAESYNLSASGYMVKPIDNRGYIEVMKVIDQYWSTCILPSSVNTA